jgi:NAD(P)-dependent dehydrogenase (short-subunit alcohol dehydrogenase family)
VPKVEHEVFTDVFAIRFNEGVTASRIARTFTAVLADTADLKRVEALLRAEPRIALLVNNAGVGAVKPLLDSDMSVMEQMIALNVTALTRLVYAAAWHDPACRTPRAGRPNGRGKQSGKKAGAEQARCGTMKRPGQRRR